MDKKINTDKEIKKKEEIDMATLIEKKKVTIQEMLDRISAKADKLTGQDNMIELNPNNPLHKEWFEDDKYKGQ